MALNDIEELIELEPEDGCFTSSRMRDEYLKSKGLPPHTRKPRQGPIIKRNLPGRKQLAEKRLTSDGQSTPENQENL